MCRQNLRRSLINPLVRNVTRALLPILLCLPALAQQVRISGRVMDAALYEPLPQANIRVAGTSHGTTTNPTGNFEIVLGQTGSIILIASFVGYLADTIAWTPGKGTITFLLKEDPSALPEVVVTSGTLKEVSRLNSPIPVEIYTPALFMKNPTPSIFESLGMINGVQPQLNCNVCNTGDIHINGMEGPYTMVLIDGMPIVSSLATVYGLAGIPNSMVKRIEVVKGPASTLYGSEAVGGLINIITKDPASASRFKTDLSVTSYGEFNGDFSARLKGRKASSLIGINYFNYSNLIDRNQDNFTDVTLQNRISFFNKWNWDRPQNRLASLAVRYVYEDRWGGELQWTRDHRGSSDIYGESIYTNRAELIGNYQLPAQNGRMFLDVSYNYHLQDSYYGINKYLASQHVAFTQLRREKKAGIHDLLFGLPFRYTFYDDNTVGTFDPAVSRNQPMNTWLPGVFVQDEIALSPALTTLAGIRYDYHNQHGHIVTPRLSVKYAAAKNQTFRLSAGNGYRVVNLFTEDHAALTGARQVIIEDELRPERSWNVNLNYASQFAHAGGFIGVDASVFYTYFTNKIVGDFLTDPELIIYSNLDGYAISRGVTINTELSLTNSLKFLGGVTLLDVYQVNAGSGGTGEVKVPQLFAPSVSGTYSLSYTLDRSGITFDLTGRLNGPMYLPVVPNDYRPEQSPWFTLMNFQISKAFANGIEVYAGAKNLLNFVPKDPLLRPFDPFDKNITIDNPNGYTFDTSYNYAPIQGIRGFLGLRYTLF